MNVDESPNTAAQFGIRSIPTMFLFKDGKQVDTKVGLSGKQTLVEWVNSHG
jgi:thioredoxin 1